MIRQNLHDQLLKRLGEKRQFIQVLAGPRQVGKTTLAQQVMKAAGMPYHYASADEPTIRNSRTWLEQQWEIARLRANESAVGALLVLDEIQKVTDWPSVVKRLWDADSRTTTRIKVVLLGSAPLLIQKGLTESLAGRFEIIHVPHWSWPEMREAFDWSLQQYIYYGAYPGAAELIKEPERWRRYILDSLVETTLSLDILSLTRVDKPALLRRLFSLGCAYSGQIVSYQKMVGQLADAGNTTTLAHYLDLLQGAGMLAGLSKFSVGQVRQRASSPKLQVLNTALMTVQHSQSFAEAQQDRNYWGRLVESAVGAHLFNASVGKNISLTYWHERDQEVDFILSNGNATTAIEVKTSQHHEALQGMESFAKQFKPKHQLLIGGQGLALEDFFSRSVEYWLA